MTIQLHRESALAIALFYPSNALMHQAFAWARENAGCDLQVYFPRSLADMQAALTPRTISIVDATDDPAQAAVPFVYVASTAETDSVAVYTEKLHEGLELLVRSHGALLLLGPLSDAVWQQLFETMERNIGRTSRHRLPTPQPTFGEVGLEATWLLKHRPEDLLNKPIIRDRVDP